MPKTKISEFDVDPANNTDINSINIAEGCAPSGINNAIRQLMSDLKEFQTGAASDPLTVGGVATFTAGTVSAPAITTAGDTNTGIYFPAADTIGFAEGGVEALRLNSNGQTATSIAGTASLPSFTRNGDENTGIYFPAADTIAFTEGGVESMRIDSSGNVGIGTSSPNGRLEVNKAITFTNEDDFAQLVVKSASGATGKLLNIGVDDANNLSFIQSVNRGTATNNLILQRYSGNVGIGTSSPATKLDVSGNALLSGASGYKYLYFNSVVESSSLRFAKIGKNYDSTFDLGIWASTHTAGNSAATVFYRDLTTESMRIDTSGNLLVGTTSAISGSNQLQVVNAATDSTQIRVRASGAASGRHWRYGADGSNTIYIINQDSAGVYMGNGSTSWSGLSDERSKDIIEPITDAVEKVSTLRTVIGKYKNDEENTRRAFLIAQDVQAVLPEAISVADQKTGYLGLSYTDVIPLLVASIKELKAEVDSLKAQINQ
jgi:hypothetical protein